MGKVSVKQRIQAVKRYLNGYETMLEIAKDIGVTVQVVSEWVRRYQKKWCRDFLKALYKI
ncbi:helix-turn-helix domain-containing protein [Lysinibacillus fusiformis]|uniref:helix-turn-helix domain-containing protein n=1 Tax=Lysinibacillus fusiformis TaxID=28031 RepID=UPI0018801B88|nr:helix-turn-helix domain-containing protein [Lysinibacillus fusiformis]MBD8519797.1 helix-turn-helix domain-containing protein [Lysinibacillus fusiformis]